MGEKFYLTPMQIQAAQVITATEGTERAKEYAREQSRVNRGREAARRFEDTSDTSSADPLP